MLHESALKLLRDNPIKVASLPYVLTKGKAYLKRQLALNTEFCVETLPYNFELLDWLKLQKTQGRQIILCTASNDIIASEIADYLGLFDEVIASSETENLVGVAKVKRLEERYGLKGFDYVGNASADLPVWIASRHGIVVNATDTVVGNATTSCEIEKIFSRRSIDFKDCFRMLRVHQWLKNMLLFAPVVASHMIGDIETLATLVLAFFAFSMLCSAVYITNDLFDLEADRAHPKKQSRPFAAGNIPVWIGTICALGLFLVSVILAAFINGYFLIWLLTYFVLSSVYTWYLKRIVLVDCLMLAILYTLRIVAGAAAVGLGLSFWLLALSIFLFLSLSLVKRFAELQMLAVNGSKKVSGRGYLVSDAPLIQMLGIVSGYVSVLVLVLYLNSAAVVKLYEAPQYIWGAVIAILFWINWIWLKAHRGEMYDDPLLFALKDRASLYVAAVFGFCAIIATVGIDPAGLTLW